MSRRDFRVSGVFSRVKNILGIEPYGANNADPGGTLSKFQTYVDRMKLLFDLVFRKADGSPYKPSDKEKKAMLEVKVCKIYLIMWVW